MIAPEQAKALNLTTAVVEERAFDKALRTVGVVVPDERRTSHVHAKVRGWIESVRADFVGQKVRRGETLLTIYSQEVFAAQIEFLALLDRSAPLPSGPFAEAEQQARDQLVAAARRRLSLWDVPKGEIARLEKTREPRRTFALVAPRSGTIVTRQALDGMFIDPSVELYVVSDLERVWVLADVYETDMPSVRLGEAARLTFAGSEHPAVDAKVSFIAPTVEEATRTVKIRFELDNARGHLRPGTFATVEMDLQLGRGLAVPESAVIRTGARAIVFVVHGEHIEPREVTIGQLVAGFYRVERGLSAGERVATGAQFLLDSESRLRATSGPGPSHGGH
jgi:Cu(I)/Ag(I) efflux system membrane fusion protein